MTQDDPAQGNDIVPKDLGTHLSPPLPPPRLHSILAAIAAARMAGVPMATISLGLDTFGDVTVDDAGAPVPMDQVLRDVVEQAVLADDLGIDFIGLGEHHRSDYAISAPEIVLAAIASRTKRIRLGSLALVKPGIGHGPKQAVIIASGVFSLGQQGCCIGPCFVY